MMKQVNAARNPIWVVLVVVAIMLPTSVAYADTGEYAGTHSESGRVSSAASCDGAHCSSDYLNDLRESLGLHESSKNSSAVKGSARCSTTKSSASSNARSAHYVERGYSVDLPAYWSGRVIVNEPDAYGTTFEVRSKKYPGRVLCRIEVISNQDRLSGGDIGNPVVKRVNLSDGRTVCVRVTNYSWIVTSSSSDMSKAEAAELVSLSTGGKTIADCERASKNGDNMVSANWIADNVKITVRR